MCDDSDNIEHLYILPSRWLFLPQFETIGDVVYEIFQNAICAPITFFVDKTLDTLHPKTQGPRNYLQSSYLAASFINAGEKNNINLRSFEILVQADGQDHLRKKVITMELLRRLLMMKRHQNIRNLFGQISIPT